MNKFIAIILMVSCCLCSTIVFGEENDIKIINLVDGDKVQLCYACDMLNIKYEWKFAEYNYFSNKYLYLSKDDLWVKLYFFGEFYPKSIEYDAIYIREGLNDDNNIIIDKTYLDKLLGSFGYEYCCENNYIIVKPIKVYDVICNNKNVGKTGKILIDENITFQFRDILENIGFSVTWNDEFKIATARNNEYMIECDVSNGIVYLHEDKMKRFITCACRICDSKTLISADVFTELLNLKISYDKDNNIVIN